MTVGVLLMTHPGIGTSILNNAKRIYGSTPVGMSCLEVPVDVNPKRIKQEAERLLRQLDQGQGVLILTDLYGATPNNIARGFAYADQVVVLAGLNLPMLLRVFNYAVGADLQNLSDKAREGAQLGVCACYQ